MQPGALLFDVFGTCVDWYRSVAATLHSVQRSLSAVDADIPAMTLAWRQAYFDGMAEVKAGRKPWRRVDVIHREALDRLLVDYGMDALDERGRAQLNQVWHQLAPWPDSAEGLRRIRRHCRVATLSNGNLDLLIDLARHGDLTWDMLFCSDLFEHFKPDPETYLGACRLLDLAPERVMMVACHRSDLQAAASFGLKTAFVHRPREFGGNRAADEAVKGEFNLLASDFIDLADQIEALA